MVFGQDYHRVPTQSMAHNANNNLAYNGETKIEDVMSGYSMADRLDQMERHQTDSITKMNAAI